MGDEAPTLAVPDLNAAAVILRNGGDTNAVMAAGYWCRRTESGIWNIYAGDDEDVLVEILDPQPFRSARDILRYLSQIENGTAADGQGGDPTRGVH